MQIRAVLFDLDGTLLDTPERGVDPALRYAIECLTGSVPDEEVFRQTRLQGHRVGEHEWFPLFCEAFDVPTSRARELDDRYHEKFDELLAQGVGFLPGAERLIRHFSVHRIQMAIATNTSRRTCDLKLKQHPVTFGLISEVVTLDDVGGREFGKPLPTLFQEAARRLHVQPHNCLVFEDAFKGVQAARAAGMRVIGVASGPEHLPTVDGYIEHFEEFNPFAWNLPPFDDKGDDT